MRVIGCLTLQNSQGTTWRLTGPVQVAPIELNRPEWDGCDQKACWKCSQVGINVLKVPWKECWARPAPSQGLHYLCRLRGAAQDCALAPPVTDDSHRGQNFKRDERLRVYGGCFTIATDRTTQISLSKPRWLKPENTRQLINIMS